MAFGKSPEDYRELAAAAHATLVNARQACGDADALTLNVSSLHHVLERLADDVEAVENRRLGTGGEKRKRDGDNRWMELATLARDCQRHLRVLNQVLAKYNDLSADKKRVTKLWRRMKFANGESLDLDKLKDKLGAYTQAIWLFLTLVENGTKGKVEAYMDAHGAELREVKHTLHWCIAKMLAAGDNRSGGRVLGNWRTSAVEGSLWAIVRRKLKSEGWDQRVLDRHQSIILRYVMELGEKGLFDIAKGSVLDLGLGDEEGRRLAELRSRNASQEHSESESESETESESSLDEESGTDMPLGRRRSSTVSAQSRPTAQSIVSISRKRSLDEIETSEDESDDEPSTSNQRVATSTRNANNTTSPTPHAPITQSSMPFPKQGTTIDVFDGFDNKAGGVGAKQLDVSGSGVMTLSVSNLPPLPPSRPRSTISDHTTSHLEDDDNQELPGRGGDSNSESDDELRLPKVSPPRSLAVSTLSLGTFNDSADFLLRQEDKVDLDNLKIRQEQEQNTPRIVPRTTIDHLSIPVVKSIPSLSDESVVPKSLLHNSCTIDGSAAPKNFPVPSDLSKSETFVHRTLVTPVIFKAPVYDVPSTSPTKQGKGATIKAKKSGRESTETENEYKDLYPTTNYPASSEEDQHSLTVAPRPQIEHTPTASPLSSNVSTQRHLDRSEEIETRKLQFQRPSQQSGLRAINSEASIARPQIPRTYASVLSSRDPSPSRNLKPRQAAAQTNSPHQSQSNTNDQFKSLNNAVILPRWAPISSADFHYELDAIETERSANTLQDEDRTDDGSEQSYFMIRNSSASHVSYEEDPETTEPIISQTESMVSIAAPSDHESELILFQEINTGLDESKINEEPEEVEGSGIMNAWSVILSQVGDDHETSLLETSGVWAQSNPTTRPPSAQRVATDLVPGHDMADSSAAAPEKEDESIRTRDRNVTLVGDSDDEPRPPTASDLWPEYVQLPHQPTSTSTSTSILLERQPTSERFDGSDTDGSATIEGDSEGEPMSPIKSVMLAATILPIVSELSKSPLIVHEVKLESNVVISEDEVKSIHTNTVALDKQNTESSRKDPDLDLQVTSDISETTMTFGEMDYQSGSRLSTHEKDSSDLGPRDITRRSSTKRNSRSAGSVASIAEQSWKKEIETRTIEFQAPTEATKTTPPAPIFHGIAPFGGSNRSWWWSSNKAARAQYQPTVEDVNDEDSLPGAHPNCWSNDSEEFSQLSSSIATASTTSSSSHKDPKSHVPQYLNPFREKSISRGYRIDTTVPSSMSDDEATSFGFPSSDENEDVWKYRSGKQIEYVDPNLSFNSSLDESSDTDMELNKCKEKEAVEPTPEEKEAFKQKIKADRYGKNRYKLEKGREAVWGSASEREERKKIRGLRKKGQEALKVIGGKKVTFEMDNSPPGPRETRPYAHRSERVSTKVRDRCQAFVEDVHDEEYLPGAHPNCDLASGSNESDENVYEQGQGVETSLPALVPILKRRPSNTSPAKSGPSSRPSKPKRVRSATQTPHSNSDNEKDEGLR